MLLSDLRQFLVPQQVLQIKKDEEERKKKEEEEERARVQREQERVRKDREREMRLKARQDEEVRTSLSWRVQVHHINLVFCEWYCRGVHGLHCISCLWQVVLPAYGMAALAGAVAEAGG